MGFLDRRPFDAADPDGRALLAALLAAYDQAPAVREFVLAAGLRPADFSWQAPMSQVWPEVLRKAAGHGRLRSLITQVAQDPGSAAYEVIARLAGEPAGDGTQHPTGRPGPVAGSGQYLPYLHQVGRIAPSDPPGLIGREEELAELARFCLQPDAGPYAWWQADAWAGKSALLSTFVLRPPPQVAQSVRIVSFFITARLAKQDNREGFIQVLLEQLAGLLCQPLPSAIPEATREPFLLDLLSQAAAACAEGGGRLVLVVDGLDEDRGVTSGPDSHSIAGLLPADPPYGMRVIVAGRPNPPVPDDVPDWHPLRNSEIIRPLAASPDARDLRRLSRKELQRLLLGSPAERDVLGLLAAARGGLSARDLAELTGIRLWEAEGILDTAPGRTFTRRASRWAPGSGPETYLLGHEELQAAAVDYFRGDGVAAYRERLHAWAAEWRARGWPTGTPEYLLGSYYRLLEESGDLPRMVACATDQARHDRMLLDAGSETEAQAEVATARQALVTLPLPPVGPLIVVAAENDRLICRNASIPVGLPALWGRLGRIQHARDLARSIPAPERRAMELCSIFSALADAEPGLAASMADEAENALRAGGGMVAQCLAKLASEVASADPGRAIRLADEAEGSARTITRRRGLDRVLLDIACDVSSFDPRRAARLAAEAIPLLDRMLPPDYVNLARVQIATGNWDQAEQMASRIANSRDPDHEYADLLTALARALAAAGHPDRAERFADLPRRAADKALTLLATADELSATDPRHADRLRARAIRLLATERPARLPEWDCALAEALAIAEEWDRAEECARSMGRDWRRGRVLGTLARELARGGHWDRAEAIAREAGLHVLVSIAQALAGIDPDRATRIATYAERTAYSATRASWSDGPGMAWAGFALVRKSLTSPDSASAKVYDPWLYLPAFASALAIAGQWDRAERVIQLIDKPWHHGRTLATLAGALAAAGHWDRADDVARVARDLTPRGTDALVLAALCETAADEDRDRAGRYARQAVDAARGMPDRSVLIKPRVLAAAARASTRVDADLALRTATEALSTTAVLDAAGRATVHAELIRVIGVIDPGRAVRLADEAIQAAHAIREDGYARMAALIELVAAVGAIAPDQAPRAADHAARVSGTGTSNGTTASEREALLRTLALAATRDWDRAEHLATTATSLFDKGRALAALARAAAAAGEWDRAERAVSLMRGTIEETKTLAAVADAQLDAAADRARPCRLLATALTRHRWFEAVPVAAKVAPDAIADLYDRLMNPPELPDDVLPD